MVYFSKSLLGKGNEEEILRDLAKNCIAKLGFVDCVVYLIDHDNNLLIQKAAYGPKNPKGHNLYNPVEIAIGQGITGAVAQTGQAEVIPNTSADPGYIVDDDQWLSEICVPIAHEDIIYGVIDREHHLKVLSIIASICAIKIKSVRANKALREKQEYLLQIKDELVELKLKAPNSKLNPHFVFNALNAFQYYVTSEDKQSTPEYLSTFDKLIRFNLKYSEEDVVELKNEVKMLGWYRKLQKFRYEGQFEYSITVDDENGKWGAVIPSSIIQILLESIIENVMASTGPKEALHFNFQVSKPKVLLEIVSTNDGVHSLSEGKLRYGNPIDQWQDHIRLLNATKTTRYIRKNSKNQNLIIERFC